jgi:hypothetical protein
MDSAVRQTELFKNLLQKISVKELNKRINFYRESVNLRTASESRIKEELKKLFTTEINSEPFSFFMKSDTYTHPYHDFNFFRIRKFASEDYNGMLSKSFPSMSKRQDVWARPASDVKVFGRLNRPNETILYAAGRIENAVYETNCQNGELFFLLVYKNKKRMRLSQIHTVTYMDELTEEENAKRIILHNFLLSEFTKIVPPGREYLYKSSIAIYEEFFYSPAIDAFTYPSTKSQRNAGFNICFNENQAHSNLDFLGLMVCELLPSVQEAEFRMEPYYDGFINDQGTFDFYPYNTDIAKDKFGSFAYIREMGL